MARPVDRDLGAPWPGPPAVPATSQLFLLRLWRPEASGDTPAWEGRIQHVLSGKAGSFPNLELLSAALHTVLAALSADDTDDQPTARRP